MCVQIIEMRKLFTILILAASLFSVEAIAQADDKEYADFKKKIEMTIRRLDMRIDKVDADQGKTQNQEVKNSSNEFKKKMEDNRNALRADLKRLPDVKKEDWKAFVEEVTKHIDAGKESARPIVL